MTALDEVAAQWRAAREVEAELAVRARAAAVAAVAAGGTYAGVARVLGVERSTVRDWCGVRRRQGAGGRPRRLDGARWVARAAP